jgi:hypothetical protein
MPPTLRTQSLAWTLLLVWLLGACHSPAATVSPTQPPPTDADPCRQAQRTKSNLVREYGESDFHCVTNPIYGVIVEQWRCVKETRVIYYSFGFEYGCGASGYELYACGSTELPLSVKAAVEAPGEDNACRVLLQGEPATPLKTLTPANLQNAVPVERLMVR